jgi:hypothetical protein
MESGVSGSRNHQIDQQGHGIRCSNLDLKLEVDSTKKLEEGLKNPPNQHGHGIRCSSFDLKLEVDNT